VKAHISCASKRGVNTLQSATFSKLSSGSVFIEAAIVIPVLFALLALAFDVGSWMYTRSRLADTAALAARTASVQIAEFLVSSPPQATYSRDYLNRCTNTSGSTTCLYTCSAAAEWGQYISQQVALNRLGTVQGMRVITTIDFNRLVNPQPRVNVNIEAPYRCLFCAGFLSDTIISQASSLVEDTQMNEDSSDNTACSSVFVPVDSPYHITGCNPRNPECR